jgi:hypothetical protein
MNIDQLLSLEYSWTASVRLNNDKIITIWWTALYGMRSSIQEVLSVSSDYPKYKLCDSYFLN